MTKRIDVAGGAGYIGSHVCVELLSSGASALVIDNLSNAHPEAINRIRELAPGNIELAELDLADPAQKGRDHRRGERFQARRRRTSGGPQSGRRIRRRACPLLPGQSGGRAHSV